MRLIIMNTYYFNNDMNTIEQELAATYSVGIYCRLSKDDDIKDMESASISHQKEMLRNKVAGWEKSACCFAI